MGKGTAVAVVMSAVVLAGGMVTAAVIITRDNDSPAPQAESTTAQSVSTLPRDTSADTTTTTTLAPTPEPPTTQHPTSTTPPPTTQPPAGAVLFQDDFDVASDVDRYDWQLFHGGTIEDPHEIPDGVLSWWGDHDNGCGSPNTRREVHTHAATHEPGPAASIGEVVWWCAPNDDPTKGHFMTAMDTVGYASIAFAPKDTFTDVHRICWDQSLHEVSSWWLQVDVVPVDVHEANGGDPFYTSPGLGTEVAFNANELTSGAFMFEAQRGSTVTYTAAPGGLINDPDFSVVDQVPGFQIADRATRYKHCVVDNEDGTVSVELYDRRGPGTLETRTHDGAMPDGEVKVIFEHSTYHPSKDPRYSEATEGGVTLGDARTVHWDNVVISGP